MQQHGKSPRKRKLMLYFTYGIMTMAVVLISVLCIFLVLGYRFDPKSGDLEQGALLQFRSFPEGAAIVLDNETLPFVTPGKRSVDAGKHTVTMRRSGYDTWSKTFSVKASELRWLNYPRLVPKDIRTTSVTELPTLTGAIPSPDKKWFIIQPSSDKPEFTLADIRGDGQPVLSQLILPVSSYTQKASQPHAFSLVEWDFGARYVLIKHTVGDVVEYIRLDRTDIENTVNIKSKLGVVFQDIHFSGTSGSVFYALENNIIRRLDSNAGTISQPIVKDVESFRLFKTKTIAYVKLPVDNVVGVGVVVDDEAVRVATYDSTAPVYVDINEYFNDYYLAIGRGTAITVYKDPELSKRKVYASVKSASALSWLRFGNSGRFVVAGTGSQFTSYDLETKEKFDVNLPGTSADATKPLQWLDDFYLVSSADNDLRITEFDGANQHVIAPSIPGVPVTLDESGRFLYSLTKSQTGAVLLQRSAMTTER